MATKSRGGAHVIEISNRVAVQEINSTSLSTINGKIDSHRASGNFSAHQIGNVAGLQGALDGKQATITGATGSFTYVKAVNFVGQTVTIGTINVSNGIITSIS